MNIHGSSPTTDTVEGGAIEVDAEIDELTALSDRSSFFKHARAAFASAAERDAPRLAVIVDLDRIEHVNDTYGHHAGSALIRESAAALIALARPSDVVGRLGGNVLCLLRTSTVRTPADVRDEVWQRLTAASRGDRPIGLEVSVGIALAGPGDSCSLDELLARAEEDMHARKRAAGGRIGPAHVRRAARG